MKQPRVVAVLLAAGGATRFGSPKQLAMFRGEPLLLRAIRNAQECGVTNVVVVLGAHASLIEPALGPLGAVTVVLNHDWPTGMASSVRAGLAIVDVNSTDAVLLLAVDQPLVGTHELASLMNAFASGSDIVAAEYNGVIGVPALIATHHLPDMTQLMSGDRGAAAWLRSQGELVTRVPMDVAASDADTVEALRMFEQM
jgi:CTP:molybdopterin cytidylyltransferase MocA